MTVFERWVEKWADTAVEFPVVGEPDIAVADLRLAVDCIAMVREWWLLDGGSRQGLDLEGLSDWRLRMAQVAARIDIDDEANE